MMDEFNYNANQYVDFNQEVDDLNVDTFFENNSEENTTGLRSETVYEDAAENDIHQDLSDTESERFFSPTDTGISNSTVYLKSKMRRSLSMGNLPTPSTGVADLSEAVNELHVANGQVRASSANVLHSKGRVPSQECINRLAQPKRFPSHENLTLAEAMVKFQAGTPKRFRSKPSPNINKRVPLPWGGTKPHSPKLKTTARNRPIYAISRDEQERLEMEEAKKFKIKAHPVSKKVLRGPMKSQVDKKPATNPEPFHLTEIKKKHFVEQLKIPPFKAQPLPKSLHQPCKIQAKHQLPTKGQSPSFNKRLTKNPPNKVEKVDKNGNPKPFDPTPTQLKPFSFEKRDQELLRKKGEQINKIFEEQKKARVFHAKPPLKAILRSRNGSQDHSTQLLIFEEEKKAREFHAKPPPKAILRSRNGSLDHMSEAGSTRSLKRSSEDLNTTTFRAKPATVLAMKPFEPKYDHHIVKIEAFQFSTDERVQARQKFEEKIKEKEALMEAQRKEQEENLMRLEEEEVAKLRKQMEYKAQPIKKYKEVKIEPSNKLTVPISPKFHTDRTRNKENIQK